MRTENEKKAQHHNPRPGLEHIRPQNMLDKIGFGFQKEIHKGFANPVEAGQPDSGYDHRIHDGILQLIFILHTMPPYVTFK
jgi:hypothetical protein